MKKITRANKAAAQTSTFRVQDAKTGGQWQIHKTTDALPIGDVLGMCTPHSKEAACVRVLLIGGSVRVNRGRVLVTRVS